MLKRKDVIEVLLEEYKENLKTLTVKELNRLLEEVENNKISY